MGVQTEVKNRPSGSGRKPKGLTTRGGLFFAECAGGKALRKNSAKKKQG